MKLAAWYPPKPRPGQAQPDGRRDAGPERGVTSAERDDLVDQVRVREEHPAAAVPLHAEFVEYGTRVFARPRPSEERFPQGPDDLSAGEASDGDDHRLTGTTSAASSGPRGR